MSITQRQPNSNPHTTLQEPYVIISQPTTATFIPTKIMETNAEKTSVRQTCKNVHDESRMAEDKKAKRQT